MKDLILLSVTISLLLSGCRFNYIAPQPEGATVIIHQDHQYKSAAGEGNDNTATTEGQMDSNVGLK